MKYLRELWPTKDQYKKWSLPSKLTFLGAYIGFASLLLTVATLIVSKMTLDVSTDIQESLLQEAKKFKLHGKFTNHALNQTIVATLFSDEDLWGKQLRLEFSGKEIFRSNTAPSIDYMGKCLDEGNKLEQLVYQRWFGGATDAGDALFIYFDREDKKFHVKEYQAYGERIEDVFSNKIDSDIVRWKNDTAICAWGSKDKTNRVVRDIYLTIRPTTSPLLVGEAGKTLVTKPVSYDTISLIKNTDNLAINKVFENNRWAVFNVEVDNYEFTENGWNVWGVLIAENRVSKKLFSFYNTPVGDSHKVALYTPEILDCRGLLKKEDLSENILCLKLCTGCSWWGEYGNYLVDLSRDRLSPVKDNSGL